MLGEYHCTAPHSSILCITLHCTALQYTLLHCNAIPEGAIRHTPVHCTTLRCTTLHCTTLHLTAMHYTALRYTTPVMEKLCIVWTCYMLVEFLNTTTPHYTALHYITLTYTTQPNIPLRGKRRSSHYPGDQYCRVLRTVLGHTRNSATELVHKNLN